MTVLTKGQLIEIYAEQKEVTKTKAKEELEATFKFFEDVLVDYEAGFQFGQIGKFEVVSVEEKDHKRRNPQTGEEFMQHVPAHLKPKFKFGKGTESVRTKLKDA